MPDKRKADKTAYIHRDLLGSVDTVTDNKKAIVYRNEFTPYGENISNLEGNKKFKKEDLRGFTGHRQISEANVINMNARLYDPELGRFTSADTIIPDPLKPMAYNRYMYVYGNPTGYRDPDGHFAITALFVIGAAIFTVGATTDDPTIAKVGMTIGSIMMMGADMGMSAVAQGATTGFTTSFISTGGDMGAAIQGGAISALSAGMTKGLADKYGHGWSLGNGMRQGASQGFISILRGGKFRHGFISGFVGKAAGGVMGALNLNGETTAGQIGSTTIVAVFGGLASQATGGDFYEGAMRAAFVHLFNDLYLTHDIKKKHFVKATKSTRKKHSDAYYIYVHGADLGMFKVNKKGEFIGTYDVNDIVKLMKADGYSDNKDVILFACQTGKANKFSLNVAEQLRDELQATIYAPTSFLVVPPSWFSWVGVYTSTSSDFIFPDGEGFKKFEYKQP